MTCALVGPWPFDLQAPLRSAQRVLADRAAQSRGEEPVTEVSESNGTDPGVYVIEVDGALAGFWIVFGPRWLDEGATGGVVPPYADALLEAATEEIWWERFNVVPRRNDRWTPLIVLEWPPALADRSTAAPPGVEPDDEPSSQWEDDALRSGTWIEPIEARFQAEITITHEANTLQEWQRLPERRSLVCVLRGDMQRAGNVHEGTWELVFPEVSTAEVASMAFEDWLRRLLSERAAVPDTKHKLGVPVVLPGERCAFPVSGWLDRDLDLCPPRPRDAVVGTLSPRDVRSRLWAQLARTIAVTLLVLATVMVVSGGIHIASLPRFEAAPELPEAKAQPALSVCSEDHVGFVEEFRCEIDRLASDRPLSTDRCAGDADDVVQRDLIPAYCGLRDRDRDGQIYPGGYSFADMAAAQACFNVLGQPSSHTQQGERSLASPNAFLVEGDGYVPQLQQLVHRLDSACEVYNGWIQAEVRGAVLAAHVNGSGPESGKLADEALEKGSVGMSGDDLTCFQLGHRRGTSAESDLRALCGPGVDLQGALEASVEEREMVSSVVDRVLGPGPEAEPLPPDRASAISRYMDARYGAAAPPATVDDPLLRCHVALVRGEADARVNGLWGLDVDGPKSYTSRGVGSQLVLDAVLGKLRGDPSVSRGTCWGVVDTQLAAYTPVHPLVTALDPGTWPSEEQQLCGQACGVYYRLLSSARTTDWVTRRTDVEICVDPREPSPGGERSTGLDRLRIPWSAARDGAWVEPTVEDVCAFNLVAQQLVPGVLPEGISAPIWAGEQSSGVAGGFQGQSKGAAYDSAVALSTFGRSRSTNACAMVAAECFSARLLEVTDPSAGNKPYEWTTQWIGKIDPTRADDFSRNPWCRLLRPHLRGEEIVREGEFDFPCTLGIDETRTRFEASIAALSTPRGAP